MAACGDWTHSKDPEKICPKRAVLLTQPLWYVVDVMSLEIINYWTEP